MAGVPRNHFWLAVIGGVIVAVLMHAKLAGCLVALALYTLAYAARREPQMLQIIALAIRQRRRSRYDACKYEQVETRWC